MNLRDASTQELERIYASAPVGPMPSGRFHGTTLCRLPVIPTPFHTAGGWLLFERLPYGIDFDARTPTRGRWWFGHPWIALARFDFTAGPSRWRPTETLRLEYGNSRLPTRHILYDELKLLDADTGLGIGGLNLPPGRGEHFFYMLTRERAARSRSARRPSS